MNKKYLILVNIVPGLVAIGGILYSVYALFMGAFFNPMFLFVIFYYGQYLIYWALLNLVLYFLFSFH